MARLWNDDDEVARILSMTDDKVLSEACVDGCDPAADAAKCRAIFQEVVAKLAGNSTH